MNPCPPHTLHTALVEVCGGCVCVCVNPNRVSMCGRVGWTCVCVCVCVHVHVYVYACGAYKVCMYVDGRCVKAYGLYITMCMRVGRNRIPSC